MKIEKLIAEYITAKEREKRLNYELEEYFLPKLNELAKAKQKRKFYQLLDTMPDCMAKLYAYQLEQVTCWIP